MELSPEHNDAVNRRRRIVMQYDTSGHIGADWQQWTAWRFNYVDQPGSQVDSIWWDIGLGHVAVYPSEIIEPVDDPNLRKWWDQQIDWVQGVTEETRKRGLEVFWNYRVNEVDVQSAGGGLADEPPPVKKAHPDWLIKTWWTHGLWNYAVPEVRQFHLAILRELAENYDFDGMQLDFSRHVPCLPPGEQWEHRDDMTEFVRMVRAMTLDIEQQRGRPFLLSAKMPHSPEGCRVDGFDIQAWAQQNLVDILTLGSRSMDVDIAAFRRITAGHNIKLQPCHDDYHTTDGYKHEPMEFMRGIFANWWQQGADSVVCFNWFSGSTEQYPKLEPPGQDARSQRQALQEVGDLQTIADKDKFFAVERRGGYPWSEGFFGRNDTASLPTSLANDGRPTELTVRIGDNVRALAETVERVALRLVLFGAGEQDQVVARLNGVPLALAARDPEWKDSQILSPEPQRNSGGIGRWPVNSDQKLLRLDFTVPPRLCHLGENEVSVRVVEPPADTDNEMVLEKLEVHVEYNKRT